MKYVVPMLESESGWGSKIDGYAGPFKTLDEANRYVKAYNRKYNNELVTPSYYIVALPPVPYTNQKCDYRTDNVSY